jgi:hypothetical protein
MKGQTMSRSIQLFVDMAVDPAKEHEMLHHFDTVFRPAARKFKGFIDVQMLKLRTTVMGSMPAGVNYRFALSYESEELRQKWVTSQIHGQVWPPMEHAMLSPNYTVVLFDVVT